MKSLTRSPRDSPHGKKWLLGPASGRNASAVVPGAIATNAVDAGAAGGGAAGADATAFAGPWKNEKEKFSGGCDMATAGPPLARAHSAGGGGALREVVSAGMRL